MRVLISIEKQPEDVYVATSADIPGLIAEKRDLEGLIPLSKDLALMLLEIDNQMPVNGKINFDFDVVEL